MEIVTIQKSLTGRYYFRSDAGELWISGKREAEAIAQFLRLDKFNPDQPRDARGRFSRVASSGNAADKSKTSPLHKEKVSTLQKRLQDVGIEPATLSHKARKSVLVAAIEAHSKGKDLREAGLLKPTKTKAPTRKPREKSLVKPVQPLRMTGENAIASHDKEEFKALHKQWETEDDRYKPLFKYIDEREANTSALRFFSDLAPDKTFAISPKVILPDAVIKENRKYHETNKNFTEKMNDDGSKAFGTRFSQTPTATFVESAGKFSVTTVKGTNDFSSRDEAENFAREYTKSVTASRIFTGEMVKNVKQSLIEGKYLKSLEDDIKKIGVSDFSEKNIDRLMDNAWVRESLLADSKKNYTIAVKDKDNNLQSALTYKLEKARGRRPGSVKVEYLATSPWNAAAANDKRLSVGAGARAIAEAAKMSQSLGLGGRVTLDALENAFSFYEKIGFVKARNGDEGSYILHPDKAKELIAKYG